MAWSICSYRSDVRLLEMGVTSMQIKGGNIVGESKEGSIKVLGMGCAKCKALERAAKEALAELGMDETVDHVTDPAKIASYGVMSTPALVVYGKVVSMGKVLKKEEIVKILKNESSA